MSRYLVPVNWGLFIFRHKSFFGHPRVADEFRQIITDSVRQQNHATLMWFQVFGQLACGMDCSATTTAYNVQNCHEKDYLEKASFRRREGEKWVFQFFHKWSSFWDLGLLCNESSATFRFLSTSSKKIGTYFGLIFYTRGVQLAIHWCVASCMWFHSKGSSWSLCDNNYSPQSRASSEISLRAIKSDSWSPTLYHWSTTDLSVNSRIRKMSCTNHVHII